MAQEGASAHMVEMSVYYWLSARSLCAFVAFEARYCYSVLVLLEGPSRRVIVKLGSGGVQRGSVLVGVMEYEAMKRILPRAFGES
jgi:hypothetical protein